MISQPLKLIAAVACLPPRYEKHRVERSDTLQAGSWTKMLKETGQWMRINGVGIYGSKAWTRLGEGADGKLNVLPGGKIGRQQADHRFAPSDIRFNTATLRVKLAPGGSACVLITKKP